jgi:hypothetical protein
VYVCIFYYLSSILASSFRSRSRSLLQQIPSIKCNLSLLFVRSSE